MLYKRPRFTCVFCLREDAVQMRMDRKRRPYLVCVAGCGAKTFIYEPESLRGLMLMEPAARDFVRQVQAADLDAAQAQGEAVVAEALAAEA